MNNWFIAYNVNGVNNLISVINKKVLVLFFAFLFLAPSAAIAEGTKEIMPYDTCISRLNFEPSFTNFALYGCTPAERLNIHIANVGEKIYYGFGPIYDASQFIKTDLVYRIKDPNGTVVVSQASIPTFGSGYIPSYTKAKAGPSIINSAGYTSLNYTPTMTGDYYIEFYFPPTGTLGERREMEFFDITVTNASNQPIKGRVWSKEWQFTVTASSGPSAFDNPFYGEMFIYSDDSIVTSVDFNGMKPYVFAMTANATGTANTGSIIADRKSKVGKHTYPQYKIFLNDPDSIVYPSGVLGAFTAPLTFTGCPGNHCINVSTNKSGAIQLLIDLNGIPGYQIGTADLLIVQNISAGLTCIPWNGLNGLGIPVSNGTIVDFQIAFVAGLTHMPIYDAESNPNGYIIDLVRPITSTTVFSLYWDDSNFSGAVTPPSTGCASTTGCHIYNNMFGDVRTINTWWYATSDIRDSMKVTYSRLIIDSLVGTNASCPNIMDGSIQVYSVGGTAPISYSLNGGIAQTNTNFSSLGIGSYTITATDSNNCSVTDTISILSSPVLQANTSVGNDTCLAGRGSLSVNVNTGTPPFQYQWNTTPVSGGATASNVVAGVYTVLVTDSFNCSFSFTDTVVNIPSSMQIIPSVLADTCSNNTGQIAISLLNAIQPVTFSWNTTPVQTSSSISNLGAGTYTVTITESASCISTATYHIINMPAPSPLFGLPDKACVGDSILIQYVGNQTPPDNFLWNFGTANSLSGNGLGPYSVSYGQIGMYYVSLAVSKLGCPSSIRTDSIELFELVSNIDSLREASCFGFSNGFLSINVQGGVAPYTYLWNPGGSGTYFSNQLTAGQYQILIEDSLGCTDQLTASVGQPDELQIQFNEQKASCVYNCDGALSGIPSGGTPPFFYSWNPSKFGSASNITNLCPGVYNLKVTDSHNCVDTASFQLGVNSPILADFSYQFHPAFSERDIVDFSFTGFGAIDFQWDFGDLTGSIMRDPTHKYSFDTTYRIELIVNSGSPDFCLDTTEQWIKVEPPFFVFIPDAFTPNGDGTNDKFVVTATFIEEYHILIFNRWGQLIFESFDIMDHWNGKYKGVESPGAVYVYLIDVKGTNHKKGKYKGNITLIR